MKSSFETLFPGFLTACTGLHDALVPFAMALLVLSFAFAFWNGPLNGPEMLRFLTKIFLVVILITQGHTLINEGQTIIQNFVEEHVPARPKNIAEAYQTKLDDAQNAKDHEKKSFFSRLFSASFFEAIVYAVLMLIAWAGMVVNFFVFVVQKVALMLCWTLTPVLFPLFVFDPLAGIAWRHLTRIVGLLLWPLGLSLAACISQGIIDGMVGDSFLKQSGFVGTVGYGLNNLFALALLAIWIIGSSVVAPFYIQQVVGQGGIAASTLMRTAEAAMNGLGRLMDGRETRSSSGSSSSSSSSQTREPVPSMPLDTPPPPPTALASDFGLQPNANDPTGQLAVDTELERLKGPS